MSAKARYLAASFAVNVGLAILFFLARSLSLQIDWLLQEIVTFGCTMIFHVYVFGALVQGYALTDELKP